MLADIQLLQKRVISLIRELLSARAEISRLTHLPPSDEELELQAAQVALQLEYDQLQMQMQALRNQVDELHTQQADWEQALSELQVEKQALLAKNVDLTLERDQLLQKNLYAKDKVQSIINRLQQLSVYQASETMVDDKVPPNNLNG